jgi:hypothetical protein
MLDKAECSPTRIPNATETTPTRRLSLPIIDQADPRADFAGVDKGKP